MLLPIIMEIDVRKWKVLKKVMKKSMRKILVACLTLAMLMVNSLSVFASDVYGDFSVKFVFHDVDNGDAVVGDPQYMVVNGKEGVAQDVDISSIMPSG